ncbi:thioredoxin family protein [Tellurirhabdus rosea]|uniref:thioredoxin family protein n=1 Tax=Tellurirhabdus rosea TaxID=2674997 RepID=UPI002250946A|nr:DUF255 domain-containing protein [Tellurirhabdus rosea]
MQKPLTLLLALFLTALTTASTPAQTEKPPKGGKINWLTIEQAYALYQKTPKKFVIDVYTDWCGWCKVMDRNTFRNAAVVDYVNRNYYAVKLNAEQREDIRLGKDTFRFVDQGNGRGYHQLAASLMNNQLSYPTTVFLDEKMGMIQPVAGYLEPTAFHQIITFIGGNHHKAEPFEQFKAGTYVKSYAKK